MGIRELKAKLSDYIRKAREGTVVLVTDRGQVVAELRAPTVHVLPDTKMGLLGELAKSGVLQFGQALDPEIYQASELALPKGTAEEVLDFLRGVSVSDADIRRE